MIDAHLHLQDCGNKTDALEILSQLRGIGVTCLMVNGTSPHDWNAVSDLATESPEVVPAFGVHPWKVAGVSNEWEAQLSSLLTAFPDAGVGEVGLDKWIPDCDLPLQRDLFLRQLALAHRFKRPVTVHCLQAWGSLLDCLEEGSMSLPFLLHSYSGPREMVKEWVNRGAYFSISGYFFRQEKFSKLEVFESIPEDRLLLETDAPEMAFSEGEARYIRKGMKNHPANIELVYERYAEWSGRTLPEVVKMMDGNFRRFRDVGGFAN